MRVFESKIKNSAYLFYRLIRPFFDPIDFIYAFPRYFTFLKDAYFYSKMPGSEKIGLGNLFPLLHDRTEKSAFDSHYFYQDIWAFKKVLESKTTSHIDVGSRVDFVGFLTSITNVTFIDIRPLEVNLENFSSKKGSILSLPYENESVNSISCLHVAEHIGLGRYGDQLDPLGTIKACKELSRVVEKKGNLYFSVPVGKNRLCFNGHRISSPGKIIDYFSDLELIELSGITDKKEFIKGIDINILEKSDFACGLFHFSR